MPGNHNDLQIFQMGLKHELDHGEKVEADDVYRDRRCKTPGGHRHHADPIGQQRMRGRIKMRHETINERIKVFAALRKKFRHNNAKHSHCFHCAAIFVQLAMEAGEEIFDAREHDDRMSDAQVQQQCRLC